MSGQKRTKRGISRLFFSLGGLLLIVSVGLLINSCSKDGKEPPPTAPTGPTAEASASIGPSGGTVEVTNPESPLYGVKVLIPASALEQTVTIEIDEASGMSTPPFQGETEFVSAGISLKPDGLTFLQPVLVTIPYDIESSQNPQDLLICSIDDAGDFTSLLSCDIDSSEKKISASTTHFSIYRVLWGIMWGNQPRSFDTNFKIEEDVLNVSNRDPHIVQPGACNGFCNLALWYYKTHRANYGMLRNRRSYAGEIDLANDAKHAISAMGGILFSWPLIISLPPGPDSSFYLASYLSWNIRFNHPVIVHVQTQNGHALIADRFHYTPGNASEFWFYDPNYPSEIKSTTYNPDERMTYEGSRIDDVTIQPSWPIHMSTVLHAGTWNYTMTTTAYQFNPPLPPELEPMVIAPYTAPIDYSIVPGDSTRVEAIYPGVTYSGTIDFNLFRQWDLMLTGTIDLSMPGMAINATLDYWNGNFSNDLNCSGQFHEQATVVCSFPGLPNYSGQGVMSGTFIQTRP